MFAPKWYYERVLFWLVLLVLVAHWTLAKADDWLTGSGVSHHEKRRGYRELNWGAGWEHTLSRNTSIVGGFYDNSLDRTTLYLGGTYTPLHYKELSFGFLDVLASGYSHGPNVVPTPPIPFAKWEGKKYGADVIWVPGVVVGLQFKARW